MYFVSKFMARSVSVTLLMLGLVFLTGCSRPYGKLLVHATLSPPEVIKLAGPNGDEIEMHTVGFGPHPRKALFFVSGSGCNSLRYYLKHYFEGLKGSWQVYAVQKRGVKSFTTGLSPKCTPDFHRHSSFEGLKSRNEFALRHVIRRHGSIAGLIGVSEGGFITPFIAAENPEVQSLLIIGDGGMTFRRSLEILQEKQGHKHFTTAFEHIAKDPNSIRKRSLQVTHRYMTSMLDKRPIDAYMNLNIPILVAFGKLDNHVPVEAVYYLEDTFKRAGKTNLKTWVIEGADHILKVGKYDLKPELMSEFSKFFQGFEPRWPFKRYKLETSRYSP